MEKRSKFSIQYYLALFAAILLMETFFFSSPAAKQMSYSKFRDLLQQDKIEQVVIEPDKIFGLLKAPQNHQESEAASKKEAPITVPRKKTPWHLNLSRLSKEAKDQIKRQFTVVRLDDPKLLQDLQAHGVDYRGKIESDWLGHFF
ncbi:MAG: ATP-dependent metallopeptidase FtsH/Yme1/Tma family protein, partial [Desulfobacterales bacterium]